MTDVPFSIALQPTLSPDECVDLCEELGLIEKMTHGEHDYIRFTERGYNTLAGLMILVENVATEDPLKIS